MVKLSMRLFQRTNGFWYVEVSRGVWRSLKTKDESEAQKEFTNLQREAVRGKLLVIEKKAVVTLKAFLDEYDKWVETNKAYQTWKRVTRIWPKFYGFVGANKSISALGEKDLDNYIDYCRRLKNKPSTINVDLRHIKAAFTKARKWKYLKENPFREVSQVKYKKEDPRFLTLDEIGKVFDKIGTNRRYRLIFALYVYTGGRREEIHKLDWTNIKGNEVRFEWTKNGKPRAVPIPPRLKEILADYRRDIGPVLDISLDQVGRGVKYFLREAGLGHIKPHDLRHTYASWLIMSGADLVTVKELLGHTSLAATQIYVHLLKKHREEAVSRLPY